MIRQPADGTAGTGAGAPSGATLIEAAGASVYRVILAWSIVILAIVLLSRTRAGYTVVYYSLVLMLVFLVVTQYQFFASALEPITSGRAFTSNAGIQNQDSQASGTAEPGVNPGE